MTDSDGLQRFSNDEEAQEPQVRFGSHWIPAHQAWSKIETANAVADVIDQFNANFPRLANALTRSVVPTARFRLNDIEIRNPKDSEATDYSLIARELLSRLDPESVLDQLDSEHQQQLSLQELIFLAGEVYYIKALRREAIEFEENRILPSQTAEIWNEMSRPAPGGGLWSQSKIDKLIAGAFEKKNPTL